MKKLLLTLLALLALTLAGCKNTAANAQPQQNAINYQPYNHPCMSRIYFDGHYYVTYDAGGRVSSPSIVHDPDCPCMEKGIHRTTHEAQSINNAEQ